jgi:hypothetical protein
MTRRLPRLLSFVLAVPATMRLTRFITTDWLGEWTLVRPIKRWAFRAEVAEEQAIRSLIQSGLSVGEAYGDTPAEEPRTWQGKLAKGLDCPFCIGFWLGLGVLVLATITPRVLRPILNIMLGSLAMNYVVGHVSSRID